MSLTGFHRENVDILHDDFILNSKQNMIKFKLCSTPPNTIILARCSAGYIDKYFLFF